jgi:hypothetical protein
MILNLGLLALLPAASSLLPPVPPPNPPPPPPPAPPDYWDGFFSLSKYTPQQLDVFTQRSRLTNPRRYAKRAPFYPQNLDALPTVFDFAPPRSFKSDPDRNWLSAPYRVTVIGVAWLLYPACLASLAPLVDSDQISFIVGSFIPSVSILFGTLCSVTASILYTRQANVQKTVSEESALLSSLTASLLALFGGEADEERAVKAAQAVADHIAVLVSDSRGTELLRLV